MELIALSTYSALQTLQLSPGLHGKESCTEKGVIRTKGEGALLSDIIGDPDATLGMGTLVI
jgi:hypothetical protein